MGGGGCDMSEYLNGFSEECVIFLPMTGRPPLYYPRFRGCWLSEDKKRIVVYTRCGGNNRNQGMGDEDLLKDPNFVKTYDDSYDSTYGCYEFTPRTQFAQEFERIIKDGPSAASDDYVKYVKWFFKALPPEIDGGDIDKLFGRDAK